MLTSTTADSSVPPEALAQAPFHGPLGGPILATVQTTNQMLTESQIDEMVARGKYPTLAQLGRMEYNKALTIACELGIKNQFKKAYPHICAILISQFDEWVEQTLS